MRRSDMARTMNVPRAVDIFSDRAMMDWRISGQVQGHTYNVGDKRSLSHAGCMDEENVLFALLDHWETTNNFGISVQTDVLFRVKICHMRQTNESCVVSEEQKKGRASPFNKRAGKLHAPQEQRNGILKGRIISQLKCILKKTSQYLCTIINSFKQACYLRCSSM